MFAVRPTVFNTATHIRMGKESKPQLSSEQRHPHTESCTLYLAGKMMFRAFVLLLSLIFCSVSEARLLAGAGHQAPQQQQEQQIRALLYRAPNLPNTPNGAWGFRAPSGNDMRIPILAV